MFEGNIEVHAMPDSICASDWRIAWTHTSKAGVTRLKAYNLVTRTTTNARATETAISCSRSSVYYTHGNSVPEAGLYALGASQISSSAKAPLNSSVPILTPTGVYWTDDSQGRSNLWFRRIAWRDGRIHLGSQHVVSRSSGSSVLVSGNDIAASAPSNQNIEILRAGHVTRVFRHDELVDFSAPYLLVRTTNPLDVMPYKLYNIRRHREHNLLARVPDDPAGIPSVSGGRLAYFTRSGALWEANLRSSRAFRIRRVCGDHFFVDGAAYLQGVGIAWNAQCESSAGKVISRSRALRASHLPHRAFKINGSITTVGALGLIVRRQSKFGYQTRFVSWRDHSTLLPPRIQSPLIGSRGFGFLGRHGMPHIALLARAGRKKPSGRSTRLCPQPAREAKTESPR